MVTWFSLLETEFDEIGSAGLPASLPGKGGHHASSASRHPALTVVRDHRDLSLPDRLPPQDIGKIADSDMHVDLPHARPLHSQVTISCNARKGQVDVDRK